MTKPKDPKDYLPLGRPSSYTPELGQRIAQAYARTGSLMAASEECGLSRKTTWSWIEANPDFSDMLANARGQAAFAQAELALKDATMALEPTLEHRSGCPMVDNGRVQALRLRIGHRQWMAERLAPDTWGARSDPAVVIDLGALQVSSVLPSGAKLRDARCPPVLPAPPASPGEDAGGSSPPRTGSEE